MPKYAPIIKVIEENYEIPQLHARRRISALLPFDYESSDKHYPVIYLQDGQNLFNPHAPFGDWAIDKSLAKMARKGLQDIIVIAIDHGEQTRLTEYFPYYHPEFGFGKGPVYIQFLIDKLIPYVNSHFRTLTDYQHTGIGGSSMGGLISLFGGLTQPEVFGKLMIFSPSLWIAPMIYHHANAFRPQPESKVYMYAGGQESKAHLPNVKRMEAILQEKVLFHSNFNVEVSVNDEGRHSESFWRDEFPMAIKWLFFEDEKVQL